MIAMPEDGSERRNCPPAVRTDSEYDVVDAEFTEVDCDSHVTYEHEDVVDAEFTDVDEDSGLLVESRPPRQNLKEWGSLLLLGCIIAGGAGGIYWAVSAWDKSRQELDPWPLGWEELLDCSYTASIDGTKELNLFDNHRAVLYDKSTKEGGKYRTLDGKWAFDQAAKHYTVTLNGDSTVYSVVEPPGWGSCMLVKGDITAADLSATWFAIPSDSGSDDPPEAEITAR
jgi:hypothetical protein